MVQEQTQKIIIGVDPGFSVTGYAVVAYGQGKTWVLDCGCLKMSSKDNLSVRTGIFYKFFAEKITMFHAHGVALETSFLGKNAQVFLKLGYLRGILYLLADQHKLSISEFAPREVKSAVTGFGGASKDQVAGVLVRIFPKLTTFTQDQRTDATDALGIALCGLWHDQRQTLLTSNLNQNRHILSR